METVNLNPGSLFGVPLKPFPPGMRWNTRREMLHEVMTDLHRGWVQDYLLRHDASIDARVLSSPAQLSKSRSITGLDCLDMSDGQSPKSANLLGMSLLIPSFKTDDISAGISLEHYSGRDVPPEIINRSDRFSHFVRNDRTGVFCNISFDNEMGVVEMFFCSLASRSYSWRMMLKFEADRLEKAFLPGSIDFDIVEQSMMNMTVAHSTICGCQQSGCVECFENPASRTPASSKPLCVLDFIQFGHFYSNGLLSSYSNGVLLNAVSIFASTSRNMGAPDSCIDKLIRWGMIDRLGRAKPVVPAVIPFTFENCGESSDGRGACHQHVIMDPVELLPTNSEICSSDGPRSIPLHYLHFPSPSKDFNKGTVRIAPAASKPSSEFSASVALVNAMEKERLVKLERRKIRKREAAFRSNVKRSERMRIARLARQNEATACRNGK